MVDGIGVPAGVVTRARAESRRRLLEHEVYELLASTGVATPRWCVLAEPVPDRLPDAALAFVRTLASEDASEVFVKAISPDLPHKSDVGGVVACTCDPSSVLRTIEEMRRALEARAPRAERRGFLLVERIAAASDSPVRELLVSVRKDPAFGTVLFLGLGGVLTEWYGELAPGDTTMVLRPGEVRGLLEAALATSPVARLAFRSSRRHAEAPLALDRVADTLERLGAIAESTPGLAEIEINPMLLARDGRWVAVDGLGTLGSALDPADSAIGSARPGRAPRPTEKIQKLLEPRSALVIGASGREVNPGRVILRNLRRGDGLDYGGLFVVHAKEERIEGVPCVRSLEAVPQKVDLAVVAIPAEGARDAIRSLCARDAAESIILIPGGFAETGREDLAHEIEDALAESRTHDGGGPVLVGGNCLGVVSKGRYNTFFLPHYKLPFNDAPGDGLVAVSQSGAYLVTLSSNLDGILHPRALISYGNQMDLTVADFLEYFVEDPSVEVLAFYIEGFLDGDGLRFREQAKRARAAGKRVVVFKAGKTALGAQAAASHTASLAGDYAVVRGLLRSTGVLVAESLNQFEDSVKVLTLLGDRVPIRAAGSPPARIAVLSNAGFECSTVMDRLYGLAVATLSDATRLRLADVLPRIAHADNPVDTTPMATTEAYVAGVEALLEDPGVDGLLVSAVPATPTLENLAPDLSGAHTENIHSPGSMPSELIRLFRASRKPMVAVVDSGRLYDAFVQVLERAGVPTYRKIDRGSRALAALFETHRQ